MSYEQPTVDQARARICADMCGWEPVLRLYDGVVMWLDDGPDGGRASHDRVRCRCRGVLVQLVEVDRQVGGGSGGSAVMRGVACVIVAFGLVVAACTPAETGVGTSVVEPVDFELEVGSTTTSTAAVEAAGKPYGGTVVFVYGLFDPAAVNAASQSVEELAAVYRTGWHVRRWDRDRWVPGLLSEVPSLDNGLVRVNDDGSMTIRYEIHPDAVWEDGTPITGADFEFTYELVMANFEFLLEMADDLGEPSPTWADEFPGIDPGGFVVEDKVFEYELPSPTRRWSNLFGVVVPKHQVQATDLTPWIESGENWYAAGPWLHGYVAPITEGPSGLPEELRERNDRYWVTDSETGQQTQFWDAQRWIWVTDLDEAWDYFLANSEVDSIAATLTSEKLDAVTANDLVVIPFGGNFALIGFNFGPSRLDINPDSLVEHLAFRQAVAHALDRQRIAVEVYGGHIDAIDSYVSIFSPTHSGDAWSRYDYNPDKAKELLAELCVDLGRDCETAPPTLTYTTSSSWGWRPLIAELVEEMLEEVGIDVALDIEHENLGPVFENGFEMIQLAFFLIQPGLGPLVTVHENFTPGFSWGTTDSTVQNPTTVRYAELVTEMVSTLDDTEVAVLISEAEQILADELVFIPLFPPGWADFWKPNRIAAPETEITATPYGGTWETFYRTDLGNDARTQP